MEQFKIDCTDKIAHIEESVKSAHKRIDEIKDLTESVYRLASSVERMQRDFTDMSGRLRSMEEKPGKRWDLVGTVIITALITAIVTAAVSGVVKFFVA